VYGVTEKQLDFFRADAVRPSSSRAAIAARLGRIVRRADGRQLERREGITMSKTTGDLELHGFDTGHADGFGQRLREAREAIGLTIEQCGYCVDPIEPAAGAARWRGLEKIKTVEGARYMPDAYEAVIVEALVGVPITTLLFGPATMGRARRWVLDKLRDYPRPAKRRSA
jgi:hypothetical protein